VVGEEAFLAGAGPARTETESPLGRTTVRAARAVSASAGAFSNSVVTARTGLRELIQRHGCVYAVFK
jgi:hypothetical protein